MLLVSSIIAQYFLFNVPFNAVIWSLSLLSLFCITWLDSFRFAAVSLQRHHMQTLIRIVLLSGLMYTFNENITKENILIPIFICSIVGSMFFMDVYFSYCSKTEIPAALSFIFLCGSILFSGYFLTNCIIYYPMYMSILLWALIFLLKHAHWVSWARASVHFRPAQHAVFWPNFFTFRTNDEFWDLFVQYMLQHPDDDLTPAINALGLDRIATFFESALYKEYDEISIAMKQHINNFDHRAQCLWALYDHDQEAFKALQSLRQEVLAPALSLPVMN